MEALLRVHIRFQNLSNQFICYVFDNGCIQGKKLEDFIMNSSKNVRYFLQIFARLPLILAVHFWFLLGPYSENSILWILCFAVKLLVAHAMARAWIFNTKTLFPYYILIYLELFLAATEESFYWTIQNEANHLCHVSSVITWGNGEDGWRTQAICFLVIKTIYFWMYGYYVWPSQNLYQFKLFCFGFIYFLIPVVLPIFGILPYILSIVGYFVNNIRFGVVLFKIPLHIERIDKQFDLTSLKEEVDKCNHLESDAKSKAKQRIVYLQQRVIMNREEAHIFNFFAINNAVRDLCFLFGFLYFGIALILEVLWYDSRNISDAFFLNSVCKFLLRWTGSFVPVLVVSVCLSFIDKFITCLSVWLVSLETRFIDVLNISITDNRLVHFTFFTLLLESGIPSSNTDLDIKAIITIAVFLYCFMLLKTADINGRKIIEVCNRSPDLKIWFCLRVFLVFLILSILSVEVFTLVTFEETWEIFFASGLFIVISNVMFLLMEWGLVSITWYMDQHVSTLENVIQYIGIAKELSYIVLLPLQFYARYGLLVFRAWWILRAGNLIFNYIVLVVVLIQQRKKMYDQNKKMLLLLDNLSDVSYAHLNVADHGDYTCSICFSSIRNGKELPCKHVFHPECLRRWFRERTVCPVCNLPLQ